ncbi:LLM class F420-dependent oxidoreductase [Streptomyces sp. NPDC057580]|uniref:LLM class F420-dependent oxidoreductase n=1 Tax=Streptomyces sp. NPDC057580 TaxID=3346173 RepID=UPI00369AC55D
METGVILPHRLLGSDPAKLRDFAQGVEEFGYTHILSYDHVLGAGLNDRPDWSAPYTVDDLFHEVFVMFGYLAAVTTRLEFTTGILVLPQRQTALVAKQAAEVAVLSGGRLRLGVGLGWNRVEFEALDIPWEHRAKRYDEQVRLLRELWTSRTVSFEGNFHRVDDAGINPLPAAPVPLWLGSGAAEPALRRVALHGDGWMPSLRTAAEARPALDRLRVLRAEHGRAEQPFGVQARLVLHDLPEEAWQDESRAWESAGATHLAVGIHGLRMPSVEASLAFLAKFRDATAG